MVRVDDVLRAAIELGFARVRSVRKVSDKNTQLSNLTMEDGKLVERVAYVIPRVAARLPWRADCLIQARAAEHWLASAGIGSDLHFGVPKIKQAMFEAHAWLTVGDRIVTGGDISGYVPLER